MKCIYYIARKKSIKTKTKIKKSEKERKKKKDELKEQ